MEDFLHLRMNSLVIIDKIDKMEVARIRYIVYITGFPPGRLKCKQTPVLSFTLTPFQKCEGGTGSRVCPLPLQILLLSPVASLTGQCGPLESSSFHRCFVNGDCIGAEEEDG